VFAIGSQHTYVWFSGNVHVIVQLYQAFSHLTTSDKCWDEKAWL